MQSPSPALAALLERGALYRCADLAGLDAILRAGPAAATLRLDRPVLGLGALVQAVALRRLQRAGHRPVVLLGRGAEEAGSTPAAREAHWAAVLSGILRFGPGSSDAVVLDTARWRDGLRERAGWAGPDAALAEALDLIEVAGRFGPVARVGALDEAEVLEAGVAEALRLGAGPVAGFTTVLAGDSWLRIEAGGSRAVMWGHGPGRADATPWLTAHPDDVPRLLRLLTDLPLPSIQAWAHGAQGGVTAAREALAASIAALGAEPILREVA